MKTTIRTNKKEVTINVKKEQLIGLAIGYSKEYKTICIILPFLVIEIKTKLLIETLTN